MIEVRSVSKSYGSSPALISVSIEARGGEILALTGPNGAGKSTLLRCILGIADFEGSIRVDGLDPLADGAEVRALIGYMPQQGGLHDDLTVEETVDFYSALHGVVDRSEGERLLADLELGGLTGKRVAELSGGQRQRLGFVVALLGDPAILILDEPSSSLDRASRTLLKTNLERLAAEGKTILLSTHELRSLAPLAHRVVRLDEGRLASDEEARRTDRGHSRATAQSQPSVDPHPSHRHSALATLMRKELGDAVRNRWILGYAAILGLLGFAAAWLGAAGAQGLELQVFGRTSATLINLCLLLSPLVALILGASSIAGERDRGTLENLLAQPITRRQLLMAKVLGLSGALAAATAVGFIPAGIVVAAVGGLPLAFHYLIFPAIALLLIPPTLGIGTSISVRSKSAVQAQGVAVFAWFLLTVLYDLLLMGTLALAGLGPGALGALLVANPVDATRLMAILALEPDLYLLGPVGAWLVERFTPVGTAALLAGSLLTWSVVSLAFAVRSFRLVRQPRRSHTISETEIAPAAPSLETEPGGLAK